MRRSEAFQAAMALAKSGQIQAHEITLHAQKFEKYLRGNVNLPS